MARFAIGVDTGKGRHRAAAYDSDAGSWVGELSFPVTRVGFERFVAFLRTLGAEAGEVLIGLEATGHYHLTLVEHLIGVGYTVVQLDPYRAAQFRRSEGRTAKTDRVDARALARFLVMQPLDVVSRPNRRLAALRELTRFRADLVRDRTMALNRLRGALDLAFPELLRLIRDPASPTVLALLAAYPTAAAVAAVERGDLVRLIRESSHARLGERTADDLLEAARTSIAVRCGEAALVIKVRVLVRQVAAFNEEIAALERAIEQEFAALGYTAADFPVGTAVSLATLVAEAGDVRRFPTAKHFLAHFGWCPRDTQSGQFRAAHPRLSKAGNRHVRRLIWMLAVSSVRHPGPYRTYFDGRTAVGKNKMHSLVAIGRKLLATIYAILKTGRPYDPSYHLHPLPAPQPAGPIGRRNGGPHPPPSKPVRPPRLTRSRVEEPPAPSGPQLRIAVYARS
jgi:transposase